MSRTSPPNILTEQPSTKQRRKSKRGKANSKGEGENPVDEKTIDVVNDSPESVDSVDGSAGEPSKPLTRDKLKSNWAVLSPSPAPCPEPCGDNREAFSPPISADTIVKDDDRKVTKTSNTSENNSSPVIVNVFSVLFAISLVAIFCYVVWYQFNCLLAYVQPDDSLGRAQQEISNDFVDSLEKLNGSFRSQDPRTWVAVKSRGLRHIRSSEPIQPAVFLLAASPSAQDTAKCLAVSLADAFAGKGCRVLVDGKQFREKNGSIAKKEIDTLLETDLSSTSCPEQSLPVVLIQELHLLPAPSPLVFFKYCDNQDAPVRRAVFIFTLRLPMQPKKSLSPAQTEGQIMSFMVNKLWTLNENKWYSEETIDALVARLTDVTILVQEEDKLHLKDMC